MSKLTKIERDTEIYYNQSNAPMLIRTNDPKLIRKLNALADDFPELCKLTEEDEICGSYFEVDKRRVSITSPALTPRNAGGNKASGQRITGSNMRQN